MWSYMTFVLSVFRLVYYRVLENNWDDSQNDNQSVFYSTYVPSESSDCVNQIVYGVKGHDP